MARHGQRVDDFHLRHKRLGAEDSSKHSWSEQVEKLGNEHSLRAQNARRSDGSHL